MYLNRDIAYKILDIDPNSKATPDEIKRAYKKKALNVHPDKLASKSNEEFLKVNAAYEFLCKNNNEPLFSGNSNEYSMNYIILFCKFCNVFKNFLNDVMINYNQYDFDLKKNDTKDENESGDIFYDTEDINYDIYDITVKIDVTLKDLYNEFGKKVKVKYYTMHNKTDIHTIIIPFIDYEMKRVYHQKGDWNKKLECYGDLYVYLNIVDCNKYVINHYIDKRDLVYSYDISVYDYYNGFEFDFKHFGEDIKICHNPLEKHNSDIVINEKGLQGKNKRGDLYIIFNVNMKMYNQDVKFEDLKKYFPSMF